MARITLQDVAERAGVSPKTVSNVVRDYEHVSGAVRERVRRAIDDLGYRPNAGARTLATGRSGMLSFAFNDLRRPYFAELAHQFSRAGARRGYQVLITETAGTAEGERRTFESARSGLVDGVVLHLENRSGAEVQPLVGGIPTVFLGEAEPSVDVDHLAVDNVAAAHEAVDFLRARGRRRIAFLGHERAVLTRTSALRLEGYRHGLAAHGLAADLALELARAVGDAPSAEASVLDALDAGATFDALVCRDDLAAIGALRALRLRGLDVPGDVAVIGWDAIGIASSLTPTLTSVAEDEDLAERALELLVDRIEGYEGPGRHLTAQHRIVIGESTPAPTA